jgi:hypothetical protein
MEAGVASLFSLHAIASFAKQMHIAKLVGKLDWGFAMDSGLLSFSGKHHFAAQVLGTESEGGQTWLWSWANTASAIPPALLKAALKLKEIGGQRGLVSFAAPELPLSMADGFVYAMIASGIFGQHGYYRGTYDGGGIYLLITDPRFPAMPAQDAPGAVTAITKAIAALAIPDHPRAIAGYFRWLGWPCTASGSRMRAVAPDGQDLLVEFDAQERMAGLTTTTAGR